MKPDIATILGLVGAFGLVVAAILQGGSLGMFIDVPSLLIVLMGSIFVAMMNFSIGQFFGAVKIALKAFFYTSDNVGELIPVVVDLAEKSRKNGIVALEEEEIAHPFLRDAIKQVVDNVDAAILKNSLITDMSKTVERHDSGRKIFEAIGEVGPAMGMIGTLIGLVQMLANMSDPSSIGPSMAIALLTTLYGAMLGNMFALPVAAKLELRSQEERDAKLMLIDAIAGIQQGLHPKVLQGVLMVHLPGSDRPEDDEEE